MGGRSDAAVRRALLTLYDTSPDGYPGNLAYSPELWEWMFDLGLYLAFGALGGGALTLEVLDDTSRRGLRLSFEDQGPGIADVNAALRDGFTTGGGMGLGLGGARETVVDGVTGVLVEPGVEALAGDEQVLEEVEAVVVEPSEEFDSRVYQGSTLVATSTSGYPYIISLTPAQAQQVALARLVLADPHTLVLDEATSLIDPRTARTLEGSAPGGTTFTTENPRVRRITPGLPVRFDFGVKLPPMPAVQEGSEDMALGEVVFAPGSTEIRPEYQGVLDTMADELLAPRAVAARGLFEPRYVAMLSSVLGETDREFGVVLIERGSEDDCAIVNNRSAFDRYRLAPAVRTAVPTTSSVIA